MIDDTIELADRASVEKLAGRISTIESRMAKFDTELRRLRREAYGAMTCSLGVLLLLLLLAIAGRV